MLNPLRVFGGRLIVATAAASSLIAVCVAPPSAIGAGPHTTVGAEREFVVLMRPGASPGALRGAAAVRRLSASLNAYLIASRSPGDIHSWRAHGALAVQPNWRIRSSQETAACVSAPSAPGYLLPMVDATGIAQPGTTPPIAILDSGLDAGQAQFAGRVRSPTDVVTHGSDASDANGHGTAVAAVAASAATNDAGVSPNSPVIPIRIFGPDGTATAADVVAGIGAAITDGAGVINISGANPLSGVDPRDNQAVRVAIDMAFSHGIVVVAASGNEGVAEPDVPAADPHVISVGAIGQSGLRARFSNYGLTLDLVAPGVQLTEPAPVSVCPSGYQIVDGTSFAAPAVSGAAALLEALRPTLSVSQRFAILRTSARALTVPGWNTFTGFGVLDVAAALNAAPPSPDPGEVDDDVHWVTGNNAAAHPPLLTVRRRRGAAADSLERNKDPADVFRVVLRRGERVTATVTTAAGIEVQLAFWGPRTGSFDIGAGKTRHRLASKKVSVQGSLAYRARRAGNYFVSVAAVRTLPGGSPYALSVRGR